MITKKANAMAVQESLWKMLRISDSNTMTELVYLTLLRNMKLDGVPFIILSHIRLGIIKLYELHRLSVMSVTEYGCY